MSREAFGVLIVGAGLAGELHCRYYPEIGAACLRAFADPQAGKARNLAEQSGLVGNDIWYESYEDALSRSDIEVVDVCAPGDLHCEIALRAIEAGKHVLMEKPMAQTLAEADSMIEAAEKKGVILGQIFQNRFNRTPLRIKELVASGMLGQVVRARMYGTSVHGVDTMLWILGHPLRVFAEWPGEMPEFSDPVDWASLRDALNWTGLVRFKSGTVAVLQCGQVHDSTPHVFPFQQYEPVAFDLVGEHVSVYFTLWSQRVQFRASPGLGETYQPQFGVPTGSQLALLEVERAFENLYSEPEYTDWGGHGPALTDFLRPSPRAANPPHPVKRAAAPLSF